MRIKVRVPDDLLEQAAIAGCMRRVTGITTSRPDTYAVLRPDTKPRWQENITAAIAEMAVCMVYGFKFSGYTRGGAREIARLQDAGPLEVRTVINENHHLLAYSKDLDHQRIVATFVRDNEVLLVGWATAGEIRRHGRLVVGPNYGLWMDELNDMRDIGFDPIPAASWHYSND